MSHVERLTTLINVTLAYVLDILGLLRNSFGGISILVRELCEPFVKTRSVMTVSLKSKTLARHDFAMAIGI